MVYRVYVEKKEGQTHEASSLLKEIRDFLQISSLTGLRVLNRYDAENIDEELFRYAVNTVFSEPQVDNVSYEVPQGQTVFAVEPLPGQYDQRADWIVTGAFTGWTFVAVLVLVAMVALLCFKLPWGVNTGKEKKTKINTQAAALLRLTKPYTIRLVATVSVPAKAALSPPSY